jgi:hypothetical protein|uniref:Uncharacterized protein n=1 Tax=candidate division WOR-3 bacterium TaxID=2052148 RepID=A0A7V4E2M0_UNCW3
MSFDIKKWKEELLKSLQEQINNKITEFYQRADENDKKNFEELIKRAPIEIPLNLFVKYLNEKIQNNQTNPDDFKRVVNEYKDLALEIQEILEYAYKNATGNNKKELYTLYQSFSLENAGKLAEKLRNIGFRLKNNNEVYERFYDKEKKRPKGIAYRIMELTRLGKRSEVFFTLLNEFQGAYFPKELAHAFNPVYPDELFKTFIYSFLSGILGEKREGGEEE